MSQVLVLGATGFVGEAITQQLLDNGYQVVALVRPGSAQKLSTAIKQKITIIEGDAANLTALAPQLQLYDIQYLVYSIGLVREFPQQGISFEAAHYNWVQTAITVAQQLAIQPFVLISANGVEQKSTAYEQSKFQGEQAVQASGLNYTILRPSLIWGESSKFNFKQLLQQLTSLPIVPVIGRGKFLLAPVWRSDIGRAVVKALTLETTQQQTLHLCGPVTFTYRQLLNKAASARRLYIPIPPFILVFLGRLFRYQKWFPVSDEQVKMLLNGNICPNMSECPNTLSSKSSWQALALEPQKI